MHSRLAPYHLAALLALTASCEAATVSPRSSSAQSVAVTVSPSTVAVAPGGGARFTAQVTGAVNTAVIWSVAEGAAGGAVTADGAYTAPAATGTFHVVATSEAEPTASASATVTVSAAPLPVTVAISPPGASVDACRTVTFTATVTGAADTRVTWSVTEGASGGSVTTAGVYTAPAAAGTFHVVATSRADPTKSSTAAVTVAAERVIGVSVSPPTVAVPTGGSAQFTATVTTSCGSYQQVAAVAADGTITPR